MKIILSILISLFIFSSCDQEKKSQSFFKDDPYYMDRGLPVSDWLYYLDKNTRIEIIDYGDTLFDFDDKTVISRIKIEHIERVSGTTPPECAKKIKWLEGDIHILGIRTIDLVIHLKQTFSYRLHEQHFLEPVDGFFEFHKPLIHERDDICSKNMEKVKEYFVSEKSLTYKNKKLFKANVQTMDEISNQAQKLIDFLIRESNELSAHSIHHLNSRTRRGLVVISLTGLQDLKSSIGSDDTDVIFEGNDSRHRFW